MKLWCVAALCTPLATGCVFGWGSSPSPPGNRGDTKAVPQTQPPAADDTGSATGQIGRAVDGMTYAPATLTGNSQLGVPFNRKLEVVGREKLYEATITQRKIGGFDARWEFYDLRTKKTGNANIGLAEIAGLRGKINLEQGYSYAVFAFEEIDRCDSIEEAVGFEVPARGRYFPVEICYGRRFSRVFRSSEQTLSAEMQAKLMFIPLGGGGSTSSSTRSVSAREFGEGLRRKDGCTEVNFASFGSVGDCFQAGPALPIRVRWREIKRTRSRSKKTNAQPLSGT